MEEKKTINPIQIILIIAFIIFLSLTFYLSTKIKSPDEIESLLKLDSNLLNATGDKKEHKIRITVDTVTEVMTGIYSQYRKLNIPLLSIEIENPYDYSISVYLESEIIGLTHKTRTIEIVKPYDVLRLEQYPQLKSSVDIQREKGVSSNLHYIIKIDSKIVSEQSVEVKFFPRDVLFWGYIDKDNRFIDTSILISAWVTPNIPEIRQLLKNSVDFHPKKSLYGYQLQDEDPQKLRDYARLQVKAIYDCLKNEYDIHYVNTPVSFTPKNIVAQRINLPSETLSRGMANCIDATVLFASAIEAIGMKAYILILPGHSLLAWSIDKDRNKLDFLDVTYISEVDFEEALKIAYNKMEKEGIDFKKPRSDKYTIISIKDLRMNPGIEPIE